MAELRPYPFGALVTRMLRELEREDKIFDLPLRKCFFGDVEKDLSVQFHGNTAATPLGPAAGPHSQMAQNIVLSWLVGCRIVELKTVQVLDELEIPRPCIDMATIGFNVEWSQELKIEQSLEEYVKGAMLIEILRASGRIPLVPGFDQVVYDISVGYDLAGIQDDRVQAFIGRMQDASVIIDRLRGEIPREFAGFRDLDFSTRLSNTLTLSTFHGCPPDEIERIIDFLLRHNGLHCTVKLNPLLLGPARTRELLNEVMGYEEVRIPDTAFEQDTRWDQMVEFVDRLGNTADELGRGFGVKFTNTLIVENDRDFFPSSEKEMYLSGPPLHVLAMNLVQEFRALFGDRFPISFAAGIGRENFSDAVALGLVPVTVCTDLLKPGGYGRAQRYFNALRKRMDEVGADNIGSYIIRAYGLGSAALTRLDIEEPALRSACEAALDSGGDLAAVAGGDLYRRWVAEAALRNTEHYVPRATADTRYARARNSKPPAKIGSHLELFDCVTCNKCVPVCPNNANFVFVLPRLEQPIEKLRYTGKTWTSRTDGMLVIDEKQQYGNFADFCNDCGNCDVFCPEDGGPYVVKPRFFGSLEDWRLFSALDGFALEPGGGQTRLWGRINGNEFSLSDGNGRARFSGADFAVTLDPGDPIATIEGTASGEIDLTYLHILRWVRDAVFAGDRVNYLNTLYDL